MNVVSPGMVQTSAMKTYLRNNAGAEEWMQQAIPFGRLTETEEIAKAVLFLASDESSFVGGEELFVDGGFVTSRNLRTGSPRHSLVSVGVSRRNFHAGIFTVAADRVGRNRGLAEVYLITPASPSE